MDRGVVVQLQKLYFFSCKFHFFSIAPFELGIGYEVMDTHV